MCGHESSCLIWERKTPFQAKGCTGERCKGQGGGSALTSQGCVGPSCSQNAILVLLAHLIFLFWSSNHQADSENVIVGQPDTNREMLYLNIFKSHDILNSII